MHTSNFNVASCETGKETTLNLQLSILPNCALRQLILLRKKLAWETGRLLVLLSGPPSGPLSLAATHAPAVDLSSHTLPIRSLDYHATSNTLPDTILIPSLPAKR